MLKPDQSNIYSAHEVVLHGPKDECRTCRAVDWDEAEESAKREQKSVLSKLYAPYKQP